MLSKVIALTLTGLKGIIGDQGITGRPGPDGLPGPSGLKGINGESNYYGYGLSGPRGQKVVMIDLKHFFD